MISPLSHLECVLQRGRASLLQEVVSCEHSYVLMVRAIMKRSVMKLCLVDQDGAATAEGEGAEEPGRRVTVRKL